MQHSPTGSIDKGVDAAARTMKKALGKKHVDSQVAETAHLNEKSDILAPAAPIAPLEEVKVDAAPEKKAGTGATAHAVDAKTKLMGLRSRFSIKKKPVVATEVPAQTEATSGTVQPTEPSTDPFASHAADNAAPVATAVGAETTDAAVTAETIDAAADTPEAAEKKKGLARIFSLKRKRAADSSTSTSVEAKSEHAEPAVAAVVEPTASEAPAEATTATATAAPDTPAADGTDVEAKKDKKPPLWAFAVRKSSYPDEVKAADQPEAPVNPEVATPAQAAEPTQTEAEAKAEKPSAEEAIPVVWKRLLSRGKKPEDKKAETEGDVAAPVPVADAAPEVAPEAPGETAVAEPAVHEEPVAVPAVAKVDDKAEKKGIRSFFVRRKSATEAITTPPAETEAVAQADAAKPDDKVEDTAEVIATADASEKKGLYRLFSGRRKVVAEPAEPAQAEEPVETVVIESEPTFDDTPAPPKPGLYRLISGRRKVVAEPVVPEPESSAEAAQTEIAQTEPAQPEEPKSSESKPEDPGPAWKRLLAPRKKSTPSIEPEVPIVADAAHFEPTEPLAAAESASAEPSHTHQRKASVVDRLLSFVQVTGKDKEADEAIKTTPAPIEVEGAAASEPAKEGSAEPIEAAKTADEVSFGQNQRESMLTSRLPLRPSLVS